GQEALAEMTGVWPTAIAYPNGNYSPPVLAACRGIGLKLGLTTRPVKNPIPDAADVFTALRLGRFALEGAASAPLLTQCRTCRSDVLLYDLFRAGYLGMFRKQSNMN